MNEQPVDSWAVLERAGELARGGEEFALATVVWRQGPSSGQQGSRAIVTMAGKVHGWIGGACAEPVVIREAQRAIADGESRLLLLGDPEQFGSVPEGMTVIPISCQSEGAMEVYIEPVRATPRLVVVGRSPMAHALCDLAKVIGWNAEVVESSGFSPSQVDSRSFVVVASQGTGDEEAIEHAVVARPAYVGLVASHRRGEAVLGYLADRGVAAELLERVHVPAGLDLGHTTHTEIAVAILAELVQLKAAGALSAGAAGDVSSKAGVPTARPPAIDPVCGMTVAADGTTRPFEHDGVTYHFCGAGCRAAFERDPAAHLRKETPC